VRRAEFAASVGYDAVVVGVPRVLRGSEAAKELLGYLWMVADQSPIPVVLESDGNTGLLDVLMVAKLAQHYNIIGLIDAIGGAERVSAIKAESAAVRRDVTVTAVFAAATGRMLVKQSTGGTMVSAATLTEGATALAVASPQITFKTRTKSVGFQILASGTAGMLESLRAGAVGVVPAFAACAPQACYEVVAAWKDGDEGLADEKQARLRAAAAFVEERLGVPGIKVGCDLNGYYGGVARLPLLPTTGDERAEVEELMRGVRS
jgi:4-hydroxy-2-oxoglutarate aldolase